MARRGIGVFRKLVVLVLVLAVGAAIAMFVSLNAPYAGFQNETLVDIPKGAGTRGIAELLTEAKVIRAPWQLLAVRMLRPHSVLQAGEYRFGEVAGAFGVFDRIARGDIFFYEVTIPEGSSMFDIGAILEAKGLIPGADFRKAAANPALIRDPRSAGAQSRRLPLPCYLPVDETYHSRTAV